MIANRRAVLSFLLLLAVAGAGPSAGVPAGSPAGTFLAGVVVDEQGAPAGGAEIQIAPTEQGREEDGSITAHTRADGAFRIEGLEPGTLYRMITWKPGFVPRQDDDLSPARPETHRLVLRTGRTATGRIVDAAGAPMAGAVLDLSQTSGYDNWIHPAGSPLEERLRRTRTGTSGTFSLPDLAPGAYELLILQPGLGPQRVALDVPSGKGPLDFGRIEIGGTVLTGKVTDPSGRALAGAVIWLRRESDQIDGSWGREPSTRTGDDGGFRIAGLRPYGEVGLDVCAPGFLPQELTLWDVSSESVPIVLQPGGRITGRVVDPDGMPVAGAQIDTLREGQSGGCEVHYRPCDWDEDTTASDAGGRFVLEPLLATTYTLAVRAPGLLPTDVRNVRIGPGEAIEDLEITLERGEELSGRVVGAGGRPVAGAGVSVADWWSEGVTDADGRYRLTGIPAGTWTIEIGAAGFEPEAAEVEIGAGGNRHDVRLRTAAPEPEPALRTVSGRVTGPGDQPLAGVQVSAGPVRTMTDATGTFSLRLREGATYWLLARKPGLALSSEQVEVGVSSVEDVEIRVISEAVLTGRVTGLEPWELASLRVGTAWGTRFSTLAAVGKDGTYRISHHAAGGERIRAEAAGRAVEAGVEIEEGQLDAVLDLHFPPVHEVRGWVVDADGRPVPRAEVAFDRNLLNEREVVTSTRADGSFTLRLEDGVYDVAVLWRSPRDPEMQKVEVSGGPVDRLELVVEVKE